MHAWADELNAAATVDNHDFNCLVTSVSDHGLTDEPRLIGKMDSIREKLRSQTARLVADSTHVSADSHLNDDVTQELDQELELEQDQSVSAAKSDIVKVAPALVPSRRRRGGRMST